MADGFNEVRALRLTEIMQDFRNLQHYIAQIRASPTPDEYYGEGYSLLRECIGEGQAILRAPFATSPGSPDGDPEQEMRNLQYVILDASARRFQAQRIYLRATAAMRWINSRNAILDGHRATATHAAALQQNEATLRSELATITDERVMEELHRTDAQNGKWTAEDPSLHEVQRWLSSYN